MLHMNFKNVLKEVKIWSTKQAHMGLDSVSISSLLWEPLALWKGTQSKRHSVPFRAGDMQDFGIWSFQCSLTMGTMVFISQKSDSKFIGGPVSTCVSNRGKLSCVFCWRQTSNSFSLKISIQNLKRCNYHSEKTISSGKELKMHRAAQESLFTSMKYKEIPHKTDSSFITCSMEILNLHVNCICKRWREHLWVQCWTFLFSVVFLFVCYLVMLLCVICRDSGAQVSCSTEEVLPC